MDEVASDPWADLWRARRAAILLLLGAIFFLALLWDGWTSYTFWSIETGRVHDDGLGTFIPLVGTLIWMPVQVAAVGAGMGAGARSLSKSHLETPKFRWVGRVAGAACLAGLLVPAAFTLVGFVLYYAGPATHDLGWQLAEGLTPVWGLVWAVSTAAAGLVFGWFDVATPLAFIGCWPILGFLYMTAG